jgi:small redox-active disulfide protein 2
MEIKVLGAGCVGCKKTYMLIKQAAKESGIDVKLVKVEAMEEIMKYGMATTPVVVIDEIVVHSGGVPSTYTIRKWLTESQSVGCCSNGNCTAIDGSKDNDECSCSTGGCSVDIETRNDMGVAMLINLMAGCMILLGLILAHFSGTVNMTSISWLWLPAFVALSLIQFSFTGFCPAKMLFEKLGLKKSCY